MVVNIILLILAMEFPLICTLIGWGNLDLIKEEFNAAKANRITIKLREKTIKQEFKMVMNEIYNRINKGHLTMECNPISKDTMMKLRKLDYIVTEQSYRTIVDWSKPNIIQIMEDKHG